jgi:hypothetical protein
MATIQYLPCCTGGAYPGMSSRTVNSKTGVLSEGQPLRRYGARCLELWKTVLECPITTSQSKSCHTLIPRRFPCDLRRFWIGSGQPGSSWSSPVSVAISRGTCVTVDNSCIATTLAVGSARRIKAHLTGKRMICLDNPRKTTLSDRGRRPFLPRRIVVQSPQRRSLRSIKLRHFYVSCCCVEKKAGNAPTTVGGATLFASIIAQGAASGEQALQWAARDRTQSPRWTLRHAGAADRPSSGRCTPRGDTPPAIVHAALRASVTHRSEFFRCRCARRSDTPTRAGQREAAEQRLIVPNTHGV